MSKDQVVFVNTVDKLLRSRPKPPFSSQPLKLCYFTYLLIYTFLIKTPIWYLRFALFPSRFPRSWSIQAKVQVSIHRSLAWVLSQTDYVHGKRSLNDLPPVSSLKHSYPLWIDAPSEAETEWKMQIGQSRECDADFVRLPGYVYGQRLEVSDQAKAKNQRVILFFHGGALALGQLVSCQGNNIETDYLGKGTAHESDPTAQIPINLVQRSSKYKTALSVEYRLSGDAPFPAQIIDCVSGYAFLLSKGFQPQNIVFSGDSAGGHLCFAVTRYLRELGKPLPLGIISFSPWVDMSTDVGTKRRVRKLANEDVDFLNLEAYGDWVTDQLLQTNPVSLVDQPYLSPCASTVPATRELFAQFPPCYITAGDKETLLGQIRELKRRLDVSGIKNQYEEFKDQVHDFQLWPWFPQHVRYSAYIKAVEFMDAL